MVQLTVFPVAGMPAGTSGCFAVPSRSNINSNQLLVRKSLNRHDAEEVEDPPHRNLRLRNGPHNVLELHCRAEELRRSSWDAATKPRDRFG